MSKRVEAYAYRRGNDLIITKKNQFIASSVNMLRDGERAKLILEKIFNKISDAQRKYYFGVLIPEYLEAWKSANGYEYCDEFVNKRTGEIIRGKLTKAQQKDKAHRELKSLFNYDEDENGNIISRSITANSKLSQEDFHTEIRDYVKEWYNWEIPLPSTQGSLKL